MTKEEKLALRAAQKDLRDKHIDCSYFFQGIPVRNFTKRDLIRIIALEKTGCEVVTEDTDRR